MDKNYKKALIIIIAVLSTIYFVGVTVVIINHLMGHDKGKYWRTS